MRIKVDGRYKLPVNAALFLIPAISIIASFFTLPMEWAVGISVLLVILPIVLGRFVFEYTVLHIMPLPTEGMLRYGLGSTWITENQDTLDGLGIALIYKYKETAQEAFKMLRAWNYGKIIDKHSNITLSAVKEGNDKYSLYIYPGDRLDSICGTKNIIEDRMGKNSKANIQVAKFYIQLCFNYKGDALKKKCIESLPYVKELILNVGYIENDQVVMYSKTGFRLQQFSFQERESPSLGKFEGALPWSDLSSNQPEIFKAIIENVNRNIEPPSGTGFSTRP